MSGRDRDPTPIRPSDRVAPPTISLTVHIQVHPLSQQGLPLLEGPLVPDPRHQACNPLVLPVLGTDLRVGYSLPFTFPSTNNAFDMNCETESSQRPQQEQPQVQVPSYQRAGWYKRTLRHHAMNASSSHVSSVGSSRHQNTDTGYQQNAQNKVSAFHNKGSKKIKKHRK